MWRSVHNSRFDDNTLVGFCWHDCILECRICISKEFGGLGWIVSSIRERRQFGKRNAFGGHILRKGRGMHIDRTGTNVKAL